MGSNEDRNELLRNMVARLDSTGVDETLLEDLQGLSMEEREELARLLLEREAKSSSET